MALKKFDEFINESTVNEGKFYTSWKKGMKHFMSKLARNTNDKKDREQYVDVYVDVSGAAWANIDFLKIVFDEIILNAKKLNYSGINVVSWALNSSEVHEIDSFDGDVVKEMIETVSEDSQKLGGGTSLGALLDGYLEIFEDDKNQKRKHIDAHIVITDGYCDPKEIKEIESRIIKKGTKFDAENFLWLMYGDEWILKQWEDSIKEGELMVLDEDDFR